MKLLKQFINDNKGQYMAMTCVVVMTFFIFLSGCFAIGSSYLGKITNKDWTDSVARAGVVDGAESRLVKRNFNTDIKRLKTFNITELSIDKQKAKNGSLGMLNMLKQMNQNKLYRANSTEIKFQDPGHTFYQYKFEKRGSKYYYAAKKVSNMTAQQQYDTGNYTVRLTTTVSSPLEMSSIGIGRDIKVTSKSHIFLRYKKATTRP